MNLAERSETPLEMMSEVCVCDLFLWSIDAIIGVSFENRIVRLYSALMKLTEHLEMPFQTTSDVCVYLTAFSGQLVQG